MEITASEREGTALTVITGRIDATTAPLAEEQLRQLAAEQEGAVIVDCSGLEYISSGGLRVLLIVEKELKKQNREIVLCALRPEVEKIFRLTGFTAIFSLEQTVDDAIANWK